MMRQLQGAASNNLGHMMRSGKWQTWLLKNQNFSFVINELSFYNNKIFCDDLGTS